jgi:hypothetical protein
MLQNRYLFESRRLALQNIGGGHIKTKIAAVWLAGIVCTSLQAVPMDTGIHPGAANRPSQEIPSWTERHDVMAPVRISSADLKAWAAGNRPTPKGRLKTPVWTTDDETDTTGSGGANGHGGAGDGNGIGHGGGGGGGGFAGGYLQSGRQGRGGRGDGGDTFVTLFDDNGGLEDGLNGLLQDDQGLNRVPDAGATALLLGLGLASLAAVRRKHKPSPQG